MEQVLTGRKTSMEERQVRVEVGERVPESCARGAPDDGSVAIREDGGMHFERPCIAQSAAGITDETQDFLWQDERF